MNDNAHAADEGSDGQNDAEQQFRARMSEEFGSEGDVLSIEEIADRAREEARQYGHDVAAPVEGEMTEEEAFEGFGHFTEYAQFANTIDPRLRAIAGYVDGMGVGTYTEAPADVVPMIYDEDVFPAFRAGYIDRATRDSDAE